MTEFELALTDSELRSIVDGITASFSKESKSYIVGGNLLEELGQAVFNEYVVNAAKQAIRGVRT